MSTLPLGHGESGMVILFTTLPRKQEVKRLDRHITAICVAATSTRARERHLEVANVDGGIVWAQAHLADYWIGRKLPIVNYVDE